MKTPKLLLLICCLLLHVVVFAQTPKTVEADLVKSIKRLTYFGDQHEDDSTLKAGNTFRKKLSAYTGKYSFTINQPFELLKNEGLRIVTSADGNFRIYSWDNQTGGTMRYFENVFQYKADGKVMAKAISADDATHGSYWFSNLFTFKAENKTYYLGVYNGIYSSKDCGTGIQVFAIENGKINEDVKLIKTPTAMRSKLYYDYDFFSIADIPFEKRPTITFDATTNTINMPLVDASGKVTKRSIYYKFTGKYFERVK